MVIMEVAARTSWRFNQKKELVDISNGAVILGGE